MITHAEFVRFRGFEKMRADLAPHAYLVGPNSAGKSTVIEAIGLAERCLRLAKKKAPTLLVKRNGHSWKASSLPQSLDDDEDPVRHEFGPQEARLTVFWATGACIHMIWPEQGGEGDEAGYFYLEKANGDQPRGPAETRELFTSVTIVPVVTPLDRFENLKEPSYVDKHSNTRLASRHFRNHARIMSRTDKWSAFRDFCRTWLPEIDLIDVDLSFEANRIGVFYSEPGSRVPKELAWAGDGIQIWVQLLWHLFRAQQSPTIVLDEPEVYLHPDLQRRLVRLLDSFSAQIILASHSADVIAEAPPEGILWVDRRLGGVRRAKSHQTLSALSASLGSSYNLSLARSMRSRLVLASDCEDVRVMRHLAMHVGACRVADESKVSLVQLRDVRNWSDTHDLGEILREVLPQKQPTAILLQAGHRPKIANEKIIRQLAAPGMNIQVLSRSEIESYLVEPDTVARVSGAAPEIVAIKIGEAHAKLREPTRVAFISEWVASSKEGTERRQLYDAEQLFDSLWRRSERRVELVRGTHVIKELNVWLESEGYRPVSAYALAKAIRPHAIPTELFNVFLSVEELLA